MRANVPTRSRRSRLTRLVVAIATLTLAAALPLIGSSCTGAEVKPGGKVPKYKVVERKNQASPENPVLRFRVEAFTSDTESLQFAAQDIIIKEFKKSKNLVGVVVGFYEQKADAQTPPYAQMTWARNPPGFLSRVGIGAGDPYEAGTWDWQIFQNTELVKPSISISEVNVGADKSVRFEGNTTQSIKSLAYVVHAPNTALVSGPHKIALSDRGNAFSSVWQPPNGFKPAEGLYVFRFSTVSGDDGKEAELWIKVDMVEGVWKLPAEAIEKQ